MRFEFCVKPCYESYSLSKNELKKAAARTVSKNTGFIPNLEESHHEFH